jgi:uncharacterized protein YjbJ (UPF0337 family)
MDKDRIAGSAKDFAGKVGRPVGDIADNAKTQAAGSVREATATAQNLYGHAKDTAREATDAAVSYAKDAYENSGDTFRDGSQAIAKKVQDNPLGSMLIAGGIDDAPAAPPAAAPAILRLRWPSVELAADQTMKAGPDGNQGFLLRRAVRIRQSAWDVGPRRLTRRPVSLTILALAVIELTPSRCGSRREHCRRCQKAGRASEEGAR